MKRISLMLLSAAMMFASVAHAKDDENILPKKRRNLMSPMKSVWAFSFLHVTEDNVGLGLSYERFLDDKGIVSLYLPISYALPNQPIEPYNSSYNYYYGSGYYVNNLQETYTRGKGSFNFYPGIKIYPGNARKRVSYALGTSLAFSAGTVEQVTRNFKVDTVVQSGYTQYYRTFKDQSSTNLSSFKMGVLVTNFLNIRATEHFNLNVEFGLGFSYINQLDGKDQGITSLTQFGVKLGYAL